MNQILQFGMAKKKKRCMGGRGPAETGRDAMEVHHLPPIFIHVQRIPLLFKVWGIKILVVD